MTDIERLGGGNPDGELLGYTAAAKIGFFGQTPIVKPSGNIANALDALGLITSPVDVGGASGYSGKSGYSGINGVSGYSGIVGYSGYSGAPIGGGVIGNSGYSGAATGTVSAVIAGQTYNLLYV
jgi:hypothetical protein